MMEWARVPKEIADEVQKKLKDHASPWKNLFKGRKEEEDEEPTKEGKKTDRRDHKNGGADAEYQKFHDKYTDDPRIKVLRLPKNEKEAKRKIIELGLRESYNTNSMGWVWENEVGNEFWVDVWEVLPTNFNPSPTY
jgi:hypothetical protein